MPQTNRRNYGNTWYTFANTREKGTGIPRNILEWHLNGLVISGPFWFQFDPYWYIPVLCYRGSLLSHSSVILVSFWCHYDFIPVSLRSHLVSSPFILMSFQCLSGVNLVSFLCHSDVILESFWYHSSVFPVSLLCLSSAFLVSIQCHSNTFRSVLWI